VGRTVRENNRRTQRVREREGEERTLRIGRMGK
jgi:hypothetical protein